MIPFEPSEAGTPSPTAHSVSNDKKPGPLQWPAGLQTGTKATKGYLACLLKYKKAYSLRPNDHT